VEHMYGRPHTSSRASRGARVRTVHLALPHLAAALSPISFRFVLCVAYCAVSLESLTTLKSSLCYPEYHSRTLTPEGWSWERSKYGAESA